MKLNGSLAISGFVLSLLIFAIMVVASISLIRKLHQLKKFKSQTVEVFENHDRRKILISLSILTTMLALSGWGLFIGYEIKQSSGLLIVFEIVFLLQMLSMTVLMYLEHRWANCLLIVVKNDHLISTSDVIAFSMITLIKTSPHHRFFYLNYRDDRIKGNVKQMKVCYSWQLKDFLTAQGLMKKEQTND